MEFRRQIEDVLSFSFRLSISLFLLLGCYSPSTQDSGPSWPEPDITLLHPEVQERFLETQSELAFVLDRDSSPEILAEKWRRYGELLQATNYYLEAIEAYEASLNAKENPEVTYLLAHSLVGQGEYRRGAEIFQDLLQQRPNDLDCRIFLAQNYGRLGEIEKVKSLLGEIEDSELPPLAHMILGEAALNQRDDERALHHFEAVVQAQPRATRTYLLIAQALRRLGRVGEAETQLAKRGEGRVVYSDYRLNRIQELKEVVPTWLLKGGEAFNRGDYGLAESLYRQALKENERDAAAHLNLGSTLVATGKLEEGLRSFEKALHYDPENPAIYFNLGTLWAKRKNDARALTYYDQALGLDPKYTDARYNRATARLRQGQCSEAAEDFGRVYRERPNQSESGRGEVLARSCAGDEEEALKLITNLQQSFPKNPSLIEAKGRLLAGSSLVSLRDGQQALLLLQPLQKAGKTLEQVEAYAMALAEVGRFEEAIQLQVAALEAVKRSSRQDLIASLERNLTRYRANKTALRPWEPEVYGSSAG